MRDYSEIKFENEDGTWNEEGCRELCEAAGLEKEWEEADGETFESVIYAAAEKLGVEI